jgi:hypothetical protein
MRLIVEVFFILLGLAFAIGSNELYVRSTRLVRSYGLGPQSELAQKARTTIIMMWGGVVLATASFLSLIQAVLDAGWSSPARYALMGAFAVLALVAVGIMEWRRKILK